MSIRARQLMFLSLVGVFILQTWWVYKDPTGRTLPALSGKAEAGRHIWLDHNCQTCHQIHGFGGFLGPDLTNATERLTEARLESVLTEGAGQMPPFHFAPDEREAVEAFLAAIDKTGRGHLPPLLRVEAEDVLDRLVAAAAENDTPLGALEMRGREILRAQKCIGCHLPNPATEHRGTNLTLVLGKLGPSGIKGILASGIAAKGMPRFKFTDPELEALLAFLGWLTANEGRVHQEFRDAAAQNAGAFDLPWFEYE